MVAVMMSPAGVASVQQNKGGVAGLESECVVKIYIGRVGRHVFTFHCVTASCVERFYCKKKTTTLLLTTPTPQTSVSYTVSESSIC